MIADELAALVAVAAASANCSNEQSSITQSISVFESEGDPEPPEPPEPSPTTEGLVNTCGSPLLIMAVTHQRFLKSRLPLV